MNKSVFSPFMSFLCTLPLLLILLHCFSPSLHAQEKFERESRIKAEEVPVKALKFMNEIVPETRLKWYREEGLNQTSIEAKFKYNKQKYSIEFSEDGVVEDIEIEVEWDVLDPKIKDSVCNRLNADCLKNSIVKVQIQYVGSETDLIAFMQSNENRSSLTVNHELIAKCKKDRVELFEYLFNADGEVLSVSQIVFKNSSHLEY